MSSQSRATASDRRRPQLTCRSTAGSIGSPQTIPSIIFASSASATTFVPGEYDGAESRSKMFLCRISHLYACPTACLTISYAFLRMDGLSMLCCQTSMLYAVSLSSLMCPMPGMISLLTTLHCP